ncbi:MAG TPA: hypothetical protein VF193_08095 [Steroidobacter sp.]
MPRRFLRFRTWRAVALAVASVAIGLLARADEAPGIRTELIAEVRENVSTTPGREAYRFVPARVLAQGQVIYYTLRVTNPAPTFAPNVVVTQRIPANTVYVPGSASGPGAIVTLSIDGGQTFASQEELKREAGAGDAAKYTHIRWQLRNPLAPGASALMRFQAVFQ